MAAITAFAVSLAVAYLLVAQPLYEGKASLLLDTRKLQVFDKPSVVGDVTFDTTAVDSQIEILKSESLARSVVTDLKLADDPEFVASPSSFISSLVGAALDLAGASVPDGEDAAKVVPSEELTRRAILALRANMTVQRVRLTYVIDIGFKSRDPGKAAMIATAIAEAYITDQTQARLYTTKRAAVWLQERMMELREQAVQADRAVQDFRTKNNLLRAGGTPLDEQQLVELTKQLVDAREKTTAAQARMTSLSELLNSRVVDAAMTAALQNEVMNKLRQQYVDAARREAELIARVGPEHQTVLNVRKEMKQIELAATAELRRVFEAAKTDYEVASAREKAAQARMQELTKGNAEARQEQGALQVLESTARAYQALHDTFLQRFFEATQQQNFATTEARVIGSGERALKVRPRTTLVLGLGTVLGLMLGCGAAFARESLDEVFRTPKQIEQVVELECLGVLPALPQSGSRNRKRRLVPESSGDRTIDHEVGIARQVVLTPFSRFTETIRAVKVAIDTSGIGREVSVIGAVSAVPGEGKSTVSANLAQLSAHGGARTLLIDCDLRNPSLTRSLAPNADRGVIEVLNGAHLEDCVWRDPTTGLDFLPAFLASPISHTNELLASAQMQELVTHARGQYQYVVLDFPPLAPVVDAKAASHIVDGFVFVVEWGKTTRAIVQECLESAEIVRSKVFGVVLNRANPAALKRQEAYKGHSYNQYYLHDRA